jgi:hypothetical protein
MSSEGSQGSEKQGSLVNFMGSVSGVLHPGLTSTQAAILDLLQKGKTAADIAKARKTSETAVYKVIRKLSSLGIWKTGSVQGSQSRTTQPAEPTARYRAHAFIITLPVHNTSEKFKKAVQQSNAGYRDGHRILLSPRYVKIYGHKGFSFYGVDNDDAVAQAFEYWLKFIRKIEGRWNVLLLKADSAFELRYETAEIDNDFAGNLNQRKEYIRIRTTDDGKEWLVTDASFRRDELETNHHRTAGVDMQEVVAPVMNDYRDNVHFLRKPSESWAMHDELVTQQLQLMNELRTMQQTFAQQNAQMHTALSVLVNFQQQQVEMMKLQMPKNVGPDVADYSELKRWT